MLPFEFNSSRRAGAFITTISQERPAGRRRRTVRANCETDDREFRIPIIVNHIPSELYQVDASKSSDSPTSSHSSQSFTVPSSPTTLRQISPIVTTPSVSAFTFQGAYWPQYSTDTFAPGMLFRDEGIFSGAHFDETNLAELSHLLYSDHYNYDPHGSS